MNSLVGFVFCLLDLSVVERHLLKFPTIIFWGCETVLYPDYGGGYTIYVLKLRTLY